MVYWNNNKVSKQAKIQYFSANTWRAMNLICIASVYRDALREVYDKSTTLPITYLGAEVRAYMGKKWITKSVNRWSVGFKLGEFTWTRKRAKYKPKKKKKKR